MRPDFPTKEQVEKATHEELGRWFRFLPEGDTPEEKKLLDRIACGFGEGALRLVPSHNFIGENQIMSKCKDLRAFILFFCESIAVVAELADTPA
jgi:hypothetical protein